LLAGGSSKKSVFTIRRHVTDVNSRRWQSGSTDDSEFASSKAKIALVSHQL